MKLMNKLLATAVVLGGLLALALPADQTNAVYNCGGVRTSFSYGCDIDATKNAKVIEQTPIFAFMVAAMSFLAYFVGIAVVFGILIGAYHIITANGNASKVEQGALTIWNSIIGLILFIFMFAAINFLVPGGLFK